MQKTASWGSGGKKKTASSQKANLGEMYSATLVTGKTSESVSVVFFSH